VSSTDRAGAFRLATRAPGLVMMMMMMMVVVVMMMMKMII
jgi:hypothetical protein